MADENNNNGQIEPKPEENGGAPPTNADFKNTPAYQAMAKQLAELQKEKADRAAAESAAKKEAEAKALESQGKYEEALKLRQQEIENLKTQHAMELRQRDITNALLSKGVTNQMFIAGAIAGFKDGEIGEYVAKLAEDESNRPFFGQQQQRELPNPPGTKPPAGTNGQGTIKTIDDYKRAIASRDPAVQRMAIDWGMKHIDGMI